MYKVCYKHKNKKECVRTRAKNIRKFKTKKTAENYTNKYKKRRKKSTWVEEV